MGYQEDQRLPSERVEQNQDAPPRYAPALPPRQPVSELRIHQNTEDPDSSGRLTPDVPQLNKNQFTWSSHDPRNASTESLLPAIDNSGKRTLLMIYIHGFMGNETSFQAFPAHVHGLVTELMEETHIVHTKIYPRYKSRRAIEFARDGFSEWLRPHESPTTDVLLLGHSMGGILSAEVVLKPMEHPRSDRFVHRILGTINFDVPFLGMHPGVVASGIGSLFRTGEKFPETPTSPSQGSEVMMPMPSDFDLNQSSANSLSQLSTRTDSLSLTSSGQASRSKSPFAIPENDPNYNPSFENDVVRPVRKGWEGALHFMTKHSGSLRQAAKAYVTSHVEFGGTMADYPKLHARYKRIRALEDVKDMDRARYREAGPPRVRFVNFYTASTGVPSKSKVKSPTVEDRGRNLDPKDIPQSLRQGSTPSSASSIRTTSPRISVETPDGIRTPIHDGEDEPSGEMQTIDPTPHSDTDKKSASATHEKDDPTNASLLESIEKEDNPNDGLPPLPSLPAKPEPFDPTPYKEKDALKLAQKEHARAEKAYTSAVKERDKAIAERKKLLEKRAKKAAKAAEKAEKEKVKAEEKARKADAKKDKSKENANETPTETAPTATTAPTTESQTALSSEDHEKQTEKDKKPKRDRKFCITPSKTNGVRDPCWVRVFMKDVDEVGAHCGLFFEDKEHYEGLVRDVADLIREWVRRDTEVRQVVMGRGG